MGRILQVEFLFLCSKDDPKHNSKWRELYTDEEIETKIKPLAEAEINQNVVLYLHYIHICIMPSGIIVKKNYQADLKVLQAKFEQVIKAGVRQIAILADDAGNVGGANYTKTLTDMTAWLKEMQKHILI